jgi:hypothetical protein
VYKTSDRNGLDPPFREAAEFLRERLRQAHRRYREKAQISSALATDFRRPLPGADRVAAHALRHTLRLEIEALRNYVQILRRYRDFVIRGIPPPDLEVEEDD